MRDKLHGLEPFGRIIQGYILPFFVRHKHAIPSHPLDCFFP